MKRIALAATVLLLTIGLGLWVLNQSNSVDETDQASTKTGADGEDSDDQAVVNDVPVAHLSGTVEDEEGVAVAGATVWLLDLKATQPPDTCAKCQLEIFDCEAPDSVRTSIERLKTFTPPKPRAEAVSDAEGHFTFDDVPEGQVLVAFVGRRITRNSVSGESELTLVLPSLAKSSFNVEDDRNEPIAGQKVTLWRALDGTFETLVSNDTGVVELESSDSLDYVFAQREGLIPAGGHPELISMLVLSRPHTLIVHTRLAGEPIEADVSFMIHEKPEHHRTVKGTLRIDGLRREFVNVEANAPPYSGGQQSHDLEDPVTELTFELRQSARLMVTLVDELGNPVGRATATLARDQSSVDTVAEPGELLVLGPVPEGMYSFGLNVEDSVPVSREIDLPPGDTAIEIITTKPHRLTGLVKTPEGLPAAGTRITVLENDQHIGSDYTGDDGQFSVDVPYAGQFDVRAEAPRLGSAEPVLVTVPGPASSIVLRTRGVLELQVFDAEGKPMKASAVVQGNATAEIIEVEEESKVGRLSNLKAGQYTVELSLNRRTPIIKTVTITEGETSRVSIKVDPGAVISGTVVDARGKPFANVSLNSEDMGEFVDTDEEGHFSMSALTPGDVVLNVTSPEGVELKHKTRAPSRDVRIVMTDPRKVRGRVVDESGRPITKFEINGHHVTPADGRFEVAAPSGSIDVWAEDYDSQFLEDVKAEVGDVVMVATPSISGEVVDQSGKPVAGVTVQSDRGSGVTTGVDGTFKVTIDGHDDEELIATRGASFAKAKAVKGQRAHLVLHKGTHVVGRVSGAPRRTVVTITGERANQELTTDAEGRFETDLAEATWVFGTRSSRITRAYDVKGDRMEITLAGSAGECGLVVHAREPIDGLWIFPPGTGGEDEGPGLRGHRPGAVTVQIYTASNEIAVPSLPCGDAVIFATTPLYERGSFERTVTISQPAQPTEITFPLVLEEPVESTPE